MPAKAKAKAASKSQVSTRMSFYPHAEDIVNLEQTRAELQATTPHVHVSLSEALRHSLREFRRFKDAEKKSSKIS